MTDTGTALLAQWTILKYPATSRARLHEHGKEGGESKLLEPLDQISFGVMNGM
jgi:hypothetical protein